MEARDSLRLSILVALGLPACAGASSPSSSSAGNDSTSVVTIAPVSSAVSTAEPEDSTEPGIPVISSKTGWITESNGNVHRVSITKCDPTIDIPACTGNEGHKSCSSDADCKEHPYGKCVTGMGQIGSYCACHYACVSDSDCDANEACICKETGRQNAGHSVCGRAFCKTDAECPSKQCGLSVYNNGCGNVPSLVCRSQNDTCKSDKDCAGYNPQCVVVSGGPDAKWECGHRSCAIGRPLVIEGQTHFAVTKPRRDWNADVEFEVASLDPQIRSAATNFYSEMAAMEHASVASFSRFSLQLMALGAPADLLREAHHAALDEIEHARIAYAFAKMFGETDVGPDKLPAAVAGIETNIAPFVKALVLEGCVGETLGAAEGREAAHHAAIPVMTCELSKIADDEERHAVLAWRTLQWALATFGDEARNAAEKAFVEAMTIYAIDPGISRSAPNLGVLTGKELGTLRRRVLSSVIAPCARALGIDCVIAERS